MGGLTIALFYFFRRGRTCRRCAKRIRSSLDLERKQRAGGAPLGGRESGAGPLPWGRSLANKPRHDHKPGRLGGDPRPPLPEAKEDFVILCFCSDGDLPRNIRRHWRTLVLPDRKRRPGCPRSSRRGSFGLCPEGDGDLRKVRKV